MQAEATSGIKMKCSTEHAQKENTHTRTHTNTFTMCLCGLSEPAKLSFLLLSEVSQRDPLVLSTCSSHSQTAEEAVSQDTAEQEREECTAETAAIQTTVQTQLPCPEKLRNECPGHPVISSYQQTDRRI